MGGGYYDSSRYAARSTSYAKSTREEIFTQRNAKHEFLPKNIKIREAFDSAEHPDSTAIIIGVDVTGSMGTLAESIVRKQLGTLMTGLLTRQPVKDPQVCFMAIGDVQCDVSPLQVTQFESSDDPMMDQITALWLEGHGGGNNSESYNLPWVFAQGQVKADCITKRNKKGYIFTMGDECCPSGLFKSDVQKHMNIGMETDFVNSKDLYAAVSETYNVFHLIIEEGSYYRVHSQRVIDSWDSITGRKTLFVKNHEHLSEIIVSTIQICEGANPQQVIDSWESQAIKDSLNRAFHYSLR